MAYVCCMSQYELEEGTQFVDVNPGKSVKQFLI